MTFDSAAIHPRYMARVAHYEAGAHFGPRRLGDYELVWLLSGSATWTVEEETDAGTGVIRHEHTLVPGRIALARAGLTDRYAWDERRPSSHAYVHFTLDDDAAPPPPRRREWPLVRAMTPGDPLAALCSHLLRLALRTDETARERSDEIVRLVVGLVLDEGAEPPRDLSAHVREALLFVQQSWSSDGVRLLSLQELAAAARVSPAYLSREFRATQAVGVGVGSQAGTGAGSGTGTGLIGALELVRLARAATALQRSNLSIEAVARRSGFANPYHFSRRFSAVYGESPGRFRRGAVDVDPLSPLAAAGLLPVWNLLSAESLSADSRSADSRSADSRSTTASAPGRRE